jgi:hypothetical protein
MVRNKEANKKYIIDFKVSVGAEEGRERAFEREWKMRSCSARLNQSYEMRVDCYWRESINLRPLVSPYAGMQNRKNRKTS